MTDTMAAGTLPTTVPGLLAAASAATGLDDFGDRHFLTGLSQLVDDLPVHAQLNAIGASLSAERDIDRLLTDPDLLSLRRGPVDVGALVAGFAH